MRHAGLLWTGVVVLVGGVTCQAVQGTDPTPAASYFTVWSAVLAAAVLAGELATRSVPADVWGAATTGVVLAGLVFTIVIAPSTGTHTWFQPHDDAWVRVATVLLHGLAPVLVAAAFVGVAPAPADPARSALRWCAWPVGYLGVVLILQAVGVGRVPYPFLDASAVGWAPVVLAALVLGAAHAALGLGLVACQAWFRRRT